MTIKKLTSKRYTKSIYPKQHQQLEEECQVPLLNVNVKVSEPIAHLDESSNENGNGDMLNIFNLATNDLAHQTKCIPALGFTFAAAKQVAVDYYVFKEEHLNAGGGRNNKDALFTVFLEVWKEYVDEHQEANPFKYNTIEELIAEYPVFSCEPEQEQKRLQLWANWTGLALSSISKRRGFKKVFERCLSRVLEDSTTTTSGSSKALVRRGMIYDHELVVVPEPIIIASVSPSQHQQPRNKKRTEFMTDDHLYKKARPSPPSTPSFDSMKNMAYGTSFIIDDFVVEGISEMSSHGRRVKPTARYVPGGTPLGLPPKFFRCNGEEIDVDEYDSFSSYSMLPSSSPIGAYSPFSSAAAQVAQQATTKKSKKSTKKSTKSSKIQRDSSNDTSQSNSSERKVNTDAAASTNTRRDAFGSTDSEFSDIFRNELDMAFIEDIYAMETTDPFRQLNNTPQQLSTPIQSMITSSKTAKKGGSSGPDRACISPENIIKPVPGVAIDAKGRAVRKSRNDIDAATLRSDRNDISSDRSDNDCSSSASLLELSPSVQPVVGYVSGLEFTAISPPNMSRDSSFMLWLGNTAFSADDIQMAVPTGFRTSSQSDSPSRSASVSGSTTLECPSQGYSSQGVAIIAPESRYMRQNTKFSPFHSNGAFESIYPQAIGQDARTRDFLTGNTILLACDDSNPPHPELYKLDGSREFGSNENIHSIPLSMRATAGRGPSPTGFGQNETSILAELDAYRSSPSANQ